MYFLSPSSVNVYCVDSFSCVEPSLHSKNKFCLIMGYKFEKNGSFSLNVF